MKSIGKKRLIIYPFLLGITFLLANNTQLAKLDYHNYSKSNNAENNDEAPKKLLHLNKPEYVRGIYLTAASAGSDEYRKNLIKKLASAYINSVVIDIKDYSGYILYDTQLDEVNKIKGKKIRLDARQVIDEFHEAGIYIIARQTVFQDPVLAEARPELAMHTKNGNIWRDNKNLAWLDPSNKKVWEYNLAIAKEAVSLGFDEINFDYMRYPSDGPMSSLEYNLPSGQQKYDIMKSFYQYLSDNLSDLTPLSIDMFGLVMDNTKDNYDLNIGQRLIDALDYFDDISPMMYASHYPKTYLGYANSAEHPGEVVAYGLKIAEATTTNRRAKIRPWLQAFSIGAVYDKEKIKAQIKAVEMATSTTSGWLFWNARNVYADYMFVE
jgi:hypothetical protein